MRGTLKIGKWLPFRARQILSPHAGYLWSARVAWLISGADFYIGGRGGMEWKLAGLKRLVHADGPDVSLSALARGAAEAIWLPTALLPRYGVRWTAEGEHELRANWTIDDHRFHCRYGITDDGRLRWVAFDRWGDPDGTGAWAFRPFGGSVSNYRTFDGLTIPAAGRIGWHYGTDRWAEGEFFRYRITGMDLLGRPGSASRRS